MQRISVLRYQGVAILFILFALTGVALFPVGLARAGSAQPSNPPPDQVAVKLKPSASINTILARYNSTLLGSLAEDNVYFLRLPAGQTAAQILPTLQADTDLYAAEPNYYANGAPTDTGLAFWGTGNLTPTPSSGAAQWAWTKTGLAAAQKMTTGQGVIVAVLDTGLASDHPLLQSSIAQGYDFIGMDNSIYDNGTGPGVGHGTHVSGIIMTVAPGVQVMPVRVLDSNGVGTYWEVAQGIRFAVDQKVLNHMNVRVINMSLTAPATTPELSSALAYAAANGVLVVAAAGTGPGPKLSRSLCG
jgi:thermitase